MHISKKDFDQYLKTHLLSSRYATAANASLPFTNMFKPSVDLNQNNYDLMGNP